MNRLGLQMGDGPGRPRLSVDRLWYGLIPILLLVCALFFHFSKSKSVAVDTSPVADALPSGLDIRPVSSTCVAPERPQATAASAVDLDFVEMFSKLEFERPMDMVQAPKDDTKWYLATRFGLVWVFDNDDDVETKAVSLDIRDRIRLTFEAQSQQWGVTSLAFHPQFPDQPYLYVAYNARKDRKSPLFSVVSRFETTDDGATFAADSEVIVLSQLQDVTRFHHMGQIAFGPDGYLYIGLGDVDGSRGQDLTDLRGSILRIDVDGKEPYAIPADNPLVSVANVREEIYAWGFRNPWRFSFDRETGDLWAGDMGGDAWEEVNLVIKGGNYGWRTVEGNDCVVPDCDLNDFIAPVALYDHSEGGSVIGGFVYRGRELPGLVGAYVYGDSIGRDIWALFFDAEGNVERRSIGRPSNGKPHVFIQGNDGELYIMRSRPDPQSPRKLVAKSVFVADHAEFPILLSQTGCVDPADPSIAAAGTIPYRVNSPLWSDGAVKQRWMAIPEGTQAVAHIDGDFEFPIGTVLVKSFAFEDTPVETRLLVRHRDGGWSGYSYEWLEDGSDAVLLESGKTKELFNGQTWTYPSPTQCAICHTSAARHALGPELAQLNGDFTYPSTGRTANQLATLQHIGVLVDPQERSPEHLPRLAAAGENERPIEGRARSYLHANCSGCHRPGGPTQALMDLRFFVDKDDMNVCGVAPSLSHLGIENASLIAPGAPERSIVFQRMSRRGQHQMPPLGTSLPDTVALAVFETWIANEACPVAALPEPIDPPEPPGPTDAPELPTCLGLTATIVGTSGDDVIEGTNGDDVIVALAGNDVVKGGGGDDVICGGDGDDDLSGGHGNDTLVGSGGDDVLSGKQGDDQLLGDEGDDILLGNRGDDILQGDDGRDHCHGGHHVVGDEADTTCEVIRTIP